MRSKRNVVLRKYFQRCQKIFHQSDGYMYVEKNTLGISNNFNEKQLTLATR